MVSPKNWLGLIFLLLILGIISVIRIPSDNDARLKRAALEWSLATLAATLVLWGAFDSGGQFQTINQTEWIVSPALNFQWGPIVLAVDGISLFFFILTALLIPICILISWNSIKYLLKEFLLCLLFLEILLMGVFSALDLLLFYILFEGILIPMFLLIGIWGSREEKVRASYYFFFYTLIGSVFMLLGIFQLYDIAGTTDYQTLLNIKLPESTQKWIFAGFFLSLAVKIPKVPFHIWLPQAHVEAPVSGSVILAGVLLKLGGYGFLRFSWPLLPAASEYFAPLIITLSGIAIVYGSLTTCRQVDFKRLIAYSSVAHMGLVTLGLFTHTIEGLVAAVFLMLAHGIVSSSLFIAVTFLYERHHTRLIKYYRGITITMPIFATMMLVLTLTNMAIPLSCNFVGEFFSLLAAFEYSLVIGVLAASGMVLSAAYSLYLYNRICFGDASNYQLFPRDLNRREAWAMAPLVILIFFLGVLPSVIIEPVKNALMFSPGGA
uniref:NADH dehydrogenase subunit 4 n=1 Tax=Hydrozoanthus antumbrosus TaxID=1285665 RepID=UPI002551EA56|nr:NADH dehydrogenase subunit 4 [Hydrozoanthus antumbrosus]YP_010868470.1 NADH dehydrogenase subunit 4 [Hydrozoanthus tunicans]WGU19943.1 NADH dehydrogenase subunit 4 [Hydrozoanthus antumbrosus]WGU19982.1 NADH dehydrogenase subunit 4 [Hydrozoanthus tunicans]